MSFRFALCSLEKDAGQKAARRAATQTGAQRSGSGLEARSGAHKADVTNTLLTPAEKWKNEKKSRGSKPRDFCVEQRNSIDAGRTRVSVCRLILL